MGDVAAVGTGRDVATRSGRAARPAVTSCAAVGQAGADPVLEADVTRPVTDVGALVLQAGELALEELPSPADERKGSRWMMYVEDPGVSASPRPVPISSSMDLWIPSWLALTAVVASTCWARADAAGQRPSTRAMAHAARACATGCRRTQVFMQVASTVRG